MNLQSSKKNHPMIHLFIQSIHQFIGDLDSYQAHYKCIDFLLIWVYYIDSKGPSDSKISTVWDHL